jgi:hypothetical protein
MFLLLKHHRVFHGGANEQHCISKSTINKRYCCYKGSLQIKDRLKGSHPLKRSWVIFECRGTFLHRITIVAYSVCFVKQLSITDNALIIRLAI